MRGTSSKMKNLKLKKVKPLIKFGTDGWRGIIARDFTFENVRYAAHAVAQTFESADGKKQKVFVGYDHRFLAEKFAEEVASVLSTYHFDTRLLSHAVSSPLLSFVTREEKTPFGIMMTASHNPAEYLGFKVKASYGGSIPQQIADKIEQKLAMVLSNTQRYSKPFEKGFFKVSESPLPAYYRYLKEHVDVALLRKYRFPVTFDALFGPGAEITEGFFKSFQNRFFLKIIHGWRDALFGGLHPEPIEEYLSDLKQAVKKSKSIVGFALDGDADRLGVIDEKGRYLSPSQVFPLLLYYLAKEKKLRGKVVQAVSLGYLSGRIAQDLNLPVQEVPVGFKYVAEQIVKGDVILGGEESGGYGFSKTSLNTPEGPILPERDGLLSALLFLEMILRSGKKLSQLLNDLQKRYGTSSFMRKDIYLTSPVEDKSDFIRQVQNKLPTRWFGFKIKETKTIDGLKIIMQDGSWLLIRPSGTEPLLRIYGEFPKKNTIDKSLSQLSKLIRDIV